MPHSLTLSLLWARVYGCLNSVEKLRPVSPTHNNEEMDVPLGSQPKKELTSASYFMVNYYDGASHQKRDKTFSLSPRSW